VSKSGGRFIHSPVVKTRSGWDSKREFRTK
jgi:hypothetical protein